MVSNIKKYKILYIRKPPTKMMLIHILLLSRAKYSEIILQITMKGIWRVEGSGQTGEGQCSEISWVFAF